MKRIFVLGLTVLMALSMSLCVGCTNSAIPSNEPLKVALSPDFPPMEFVDSSKEGQEQFIGFDVLLAKYIAEGLGREIEFVPLDFSACQDAVETGKVDMSISGYAYSDERKERFNVSDFYDSGDEEKKQVVLVREDMVGQFETEEDFAGLDIGVQENSVQKSLCEEKLPASVQIHTYVDTDHSVAALLNGEIDGIALSAVTADAFVAANEGKIARSGFSFVTSYEEELNIILLPKGADKLTAQVNELLAEADALGYYEDWYGIAKELSGIETAISVTYDAEGNVVEAV